MAYVRQKSIRSTLNKSINYIVNPKKTDDNLLVSGLNCSINPKVAYKQMLFTKNQFSKTDKVLGHHFIQSFKPGEIQDVNIAHKIGLEFAEKLSNSNYQVIVSTHTDKGHIHNHFIMNSVSFIDGKKYDSNKKQLENIREISDEICTNYDLSIIKRNSKNKANSYKEWSEDKKGNSWKSQIKNEIDKLIKNNVESFEDLVNQLEENGYEVKYKGLKNISFKAPGQIRFTRGKTLGEDYTEEALRERIDKEKVRFIKYKNEDKKQWIDYDVYRFKYKKGSLANNIELTALIIKNLIGINNNTRNKKVKVNRSYSLNALKELERALQIIDKRNIETKEDITENINKCNQDNILINKYIDKAKTQLKDIEKIEKLIKEYEKENEKLEDYNKSIISRIKYKKEIKNIEDLKESLSKYNINNNKDAQLIKNKRETYE
ncbi:hypothetical protein FDE85_17155, partial [Clostridium botulinum]|nr:hypothetical protein [Clostridium botulinum]